MGGRKLTFDKNSLLDTWHSCDDDDDAPDSWDYLSARYLGCNTGYGFDILRKGNYAQRLIRFNYQNFRTLGYYITEVKCPTSAFQAFFINAN